MTERARTFTDEQVRQIRREYREPCPHCGRFAQVKELAKKYGASSTIISNVINGRGTYFWVEDE
jgi:Mor family transcriptional regulator